jgi:putative chitinase
MDKLEKVLADFLVELKEILGEVKQASPEVVKESVDPSYDGPAFFNSIRKSLFGRLTPAQVEGTEAKINAFIEAGWPISWAAYALATSYHETAGRMLPVREGLNASEAWRKKTLRYYPWYGRGDVQLTWESNYKKADEELGLGGKLINNLDLALDKDISARILVQGMAEGWFSGDKLGRHTLQRHLPSTTEAAFEQFKQARRIINLMDKADLIANHALKFQTALKEAKYP